MGHLCELTICNFVVHIKHMFRWICDNIYIQYTNHLLDPMYCYMHKVEETAKAPSRL